MRKGHENKECKIAEIKQGYPKMEGNKTNEGRHQVIENQGGGLYDSVNITSDGLSRQ